MNRFLITALLMAALNSCFARAPLNGEVDDGEEWYSDARTRDLSLFDTQYVAMLEEQIGNASFGSPQITQVLSKLGKIAFYMRLYRSWIRSPSTGQRGFEKFFPEPQVKFHAWVYDDCSTNIKNCIDKIYANIQSRTPLLFPRKDQQMNDFTLDEVVFSRSVSNSLFSYDVSVSYLMCFLAKNQFSLLRRLPFCSYGLAEHHQKTWPSELFRDFKSRAEFDPEAIAVEPIDNMQNQIDFQCADESFCPDPCCGRLTGRSSSSDSSNETFCANSICLENMLHQTNSDMASREVNARHKIATIPTHSCYVNACFNDDLQGMMENRWNLSCACLTATGAKDESRIYRFDVRQCVDIDECLYEECGENEKCINTVGGFKCVCKLGYLRQPVPNSPTLQIPSSSNSSSVRGECAKIQEMKLSDLWHGP